MDQPAFLEILNSEFAMQPTTGQERLFYAFSRMVFSPKERLALMIKGYAGTGKTTCVRTMVNSLAQVGFKSVLLAPTGRAAKVLGLYSQHKASTIHKEIYMKRMDSGGRVWFELRENEHVNTVFFIDEASMIGTDQLVLDDDEFFAGSLLEDLITHVYSGEGCKLVIIGDTAQLPPVGSSMSPSLNLEGLRDEYHLNIAGVELTEVIRQKAGSGILTNATSLRELIVSGGEGLPQFSTETYTDVERVMSDMQPLIEDALNRYGVEDMVVITRSNKRANLFNQQIRNRILWHEEEINSNDRLMVIKNNYYWLEQLEKNEVGFIANGDILRVRRIKKFEDRGPFRFCKADVVFEDYPELPEMEVIMLCNTIMEESAQLAKNLSKKLFEICSQDYPDAVSLGHLRRLLQKDPYYNALHMKFAYAITCHKAQGGQWPCVFIDQGYLTDEMAGLELNRWFYTALTRAQEKVYLVGFQDKLMVESERGLF
ncbi:MAG: hypothetical protein RL092_665 [Bacteroidota bacterium]|jgi:exodeoxyribonuclease-5